MIEIQKIDITKEDEAKKTFIFPFKADNVLYVNVRKGKIVGEHYHKGTVKVKDPEVVVLLTGKAIFRVKDVKTGEQKEETVEAVSRVVIPANVYHEIEALEDITFIEPFDEDAKQDSYDLK